MRIANLLLHDLPGELPADHRRDWVPGGYFGTAATIERMREFVTQYKRDFNIRTLAAKIIKDCQAKDYYCYAKALYEFCRDRIKYVYDPHLVELVESPLRVLEIGIADCDSICTLLASLNESIGLKTRFRTIKADPKRPSDFSHVYCMVRVPQSRFSQSRVTGWLSEDATLPDKQFGWEPPGNFAKKDWAASKDKDGEDGDDPLLGEFTMTPMNETQAQMEIDQLCSAMNQKLVDAMRKGLEWTDPQKANVLAIVVGKFSQVASAPGSPLQKLASVRNGYAYWSPVVESAGENLQPESVMAPNMSGYTQLNDLGYVAPLRPRMGPYPYWSRAALGGLGAEVAKVPDEIYTQRYKAYLNTVETKLQNLLYSGAEAKYPGEVSNIQTGLYMMRSAESQAAALGAEATERAIYKLYVPTVEAEVNLARKLEMKYPAGTFDSPKQAESGRSWWEYLINPVAQAEAVYRMAVPPATVGGGMKTVTPTPMEKMLTKPDVAPAIPPGGKVIVTSQGKKMIVDKEGIIIGPAPEPDVRQKLDWVPIAIGLAATAGTLFFLSRRKEGV